MALGTVTKASKLALKPSCYASLGAQMVKESACNVGDLGFNPWDQEDPLERGMATRSSILAWRIPWTEELTLTSVQFSSLVVSDSLRSHELQHARPPCPSPTPGVTQTHVHRVGDAIQPFHPLSSPSPPAPNPSQHQSLFQ